MEFQGNIKPKALRTRVKIDPKIRYIYAYFWVLSGSRDFSSAGYKPIRTADITTHLNEQNLTGYRRKRAYDLILVLDGEFLESRNSSKTTTTQVILDDG
jgi:hypothetical protein